MPSINTPRTPAASASTPFCTSDLLEKMNALSLQNTQNLMNLASHQSSVRAVSPSGTTPQDTVSFSGNGIAIVQPSTSPSMTSWHCETGNAIKQRHNPELINPTLEKLAYIPVIVEKDEKTWDLAKITLIDSNNKPFRDEWGAIYSTYLPTHALLHSEFQAPEYKKQLLSYFITSPEKN